MIIQETILKDIIDLATDFSKSDVIELLVGKQDQRSIKSITSKAKQLTLTFPVICSRHLTMDTASIIAKAIERQAAAMLQIVLSACSTSTSSKDAFDFISNFHTNLSADGMSLDSFLDTLDKLVDEGTIIPIEDTFYTIKENLRQLSSVDSFFNEDFNKDSLQRFSINTIYENRIVTEAPSPNDISDDLRNVATAAKALTDIEKTNRDLLKDNLINTDVKKANELMPTMMIAQFVANVDGESEPIRTSFILGVKAKIYPVSSEDILNRIKIKHTSKNLTLNLIKATTSEIGFFKDFLFAIDKAKLDAVSQSERVHASSKLWKILERRALKSKMRRSLFMKNDATAISTLVITQEEAEYLLKTTGINIEETKVVRQILEAYNLMGFVICDEVLEYAKFIFDTGDDMFENITYNNLEKSSPDETKKIMNMINKIR